MEDVLVGGRRKGLVVNNMSLTEAISFFEQGGNCKWYTYSPT